MRLLQWLFQFWCLNQFCFFLFGNNAKGQASQNATTGQGWGTQYNNEANGVLGQELPFLESELNNPTGLGQNTVTQMKTQGGEAAAGAAGQAKEAALLNASRTGNTAATPGIIDAAARNSQSGETTAANNVDIQNAMLKQQQQQAGASGLEKLYGTDVGASLNALGASTQAANVENTAGQAGFQDVMGIINSASNLAGTPGPLAAFGV
jgi:hypothetical protein